MPSKHLFFQKLVSPLLKLYERPEAEEIAYRLIDAYLNKKRLEFWDITSSAIDIDSAEIKAKFEGATEKLLQHTPVQYVVGHTYFLDYKFRVTPDVLIPRQETEELASIIIENEKSGKNINALDIGTGSGCLAITLDKHLHCKKFIGIDISSAALKIAKANGEALKSKASFYKHDVLKQPLKEKDLDFIVSNPPYVLNSDKENMDMNVLIYEPEVALFVPDHDPLKFYKTIVTSGLKALKPKGRIYLEIHESFGSQVKSLLEDAGYQHVKIIKDLFLEKDRIVMGKRR